MRTDSPSVSTESAPHVQAARRFMTRSVPGSVRDANHGGERELIAIAVVRARRRERGGEDQIVARHHARGGAEVEEERAAVEDEAAAERELEDVGARADAAVDDGER